MRALKLYLTDLFFLHKDIILRALRAITRSDSPTISVAASNLIFFLKRSKLRVSFENKKEIFCIGDGQRHHFFGNLQRGLDLYSDGIEARSRRLFDSYSLGKIKFVESDVVVDCGANYADLWLSLGALIKEQNYITFEPGRREHSCIIENAPGGRHNLTGLSNRNGLSKFYLNEKSADSSIIEPKTYSKIVEVETITLDKYVSDKDIKTIKLVKLEAEGFEPEIIEGMAKTFKIIEYIALDGGYERGKKEVETFSDVCNTLHDHGFELVSVNFEWARGLFVNKQMHQI